MRRLRWLGPEGRGIPSRPFRDSAVVYALLAAVIVIVAAVTGGGLVRAIGFALVFFLVATGWSWYRWRERMREERRRA